MPYRSSRRIARRPMRRPMRRNRFKRSSALISKVKRNPFPQYQFAKLRYTDSFTLTITSGSPANYQFNLMNLHDPNRTGAGHQPYYYDQLTTLYNLGAVYGCSIELRFISSGSVKTVIRPSTLTTAPTDLELEEERPYSKNRLFAAGGPAGYLRGYASLPALFGISKGNLLIDDLHHQTLGSGGPTKVGVWNIISNTLDGSSSASVYCNVKLVYYAKIFNRKNVTQS